MMTGVTERASLFGDPRSLVGVTTHPGEAPSIPLPAIVIVNTGIVHRIGHNRMYVTLARELAGLGHHVLRFDLSGIGDSRSRGGALDPMATSLTDVSQAIDHLERTCGAREFVIIGLCSGADIALRYGPVDPRVVGLVLLDPTIPPTARFYVDYVTQRLTRLQSWLSFVTGRGRLWSDLIARMRTSITRKSPAEAPVAAEPAGRWSLETIFASLVQDRTRFLVVLTGDARQGRQSYREQLLDAFPNVLFGDSLHIEHFAGADHVFSAPEDRARLNELVLTWVSNTRFGRASAAMPTRQTGHARGLLARADPMGRSAGSS